MEYPILDLKETGKRIKDLREESKLSVEDVTRFLGDISAQSVYKWQRGESLPTVDNLYALSKLFNTPVDDILRGNRERDEGPSLSIFIIGCLVRYLLFQTDHPAGLTFRRNYYIYWV